MTEQQTPPDWVLIEAAKRCEWDTTIDNLRSCYELSSGAYRALCDMIVKYEQPPVDRRAACVKRAIWEWEHTMVSFSANTQSREWIGLRAIELWEEGFGND